MYIENTSHTPYGRQIARKIFSNVAIWIGESEEIEMVGERIWIISGEFNLITVVTPLIKDKDIEMIFRNINANEEFIYM